jgi:phage terminase large subunit-like protein
MYQDRKISDVLRKLKELELTYKQKMTKRFMSSHFWWNMNHKSSKSIDPILAPL